MYTRESHIKTTKCFNFTFVKEEKKNISRQQQQHFTWLEGGRKRKQHINLIKIMYVTGIAVHPVGSFLNS